tara:strand:- start:8939 stop:9169 length:231 start_codon:yes stop_codon:yes gene_type:complete
VRLKEALRAAGGKKESLKSIDILWGTSANEFEPCTMCEPKQTKSPRLILGGEDCGEARRLNSLSVRPCEVNLDSAA